MQMASKGFWVSAGSLKLQCQRLVQILICRQERTVSIVSKVCAPLLQLQQQHHAASGHLCNRNHQNSASSPAIPRPRLWSTNTKSGWNPTVVSTRVPNSKPATGPSSSRAIGDKWRKDFLEKQPDQRKKFARVQAAPGIKDEDWWTPDPLTGVYVPEYYHGCVTTAPRETRRKSSGLGASYARNETDLDQNQGPWFDNMEELPDMERHKEK